MATKIGEFSIDSVDGKYLIIHKNEIIHMVDTFDSAIKLTQVFNKIYKSGREDGGDRLSRLRSMSKL
ncbi:hypothetical protein D7X33_35525 [Butyricicoccus sp. 1XD8-22]|nr:hypothetical protein D7X33_35525 [Butyricicoccus sp. 1XD8-22]